MTTTVRVLFVLLSLLSAPLLSGIINKTKALMGGRKGQPLLQLYYDIGKLFRKGAVYSTSTTGVFKVTPWIGLAAVLTAFLLVPLPGYPALVSFPGDLFLLVYLLGVLRFGLVLGALDTGSSFEGMGASREVQFAFLSEPALLLSFAVLFFGLEGTTLGEILNDPFHIGAEKTVALYFVSVSLFIVLLAENARIPFDDPNTHLELTMIHEVMVLDHGGPDFGCILYASSLKLWLLGSLWTGVTLPFRQGNPWMDLLIHFLCMGVVGICIGFIESILARVRLVRVSHALSLASVIAILGLLWIVG